MTARPWMYRVVFCAAVVVGLAGTAAAMTFEQAQPAAVAAANPDSEAEQFLDRYVAADGRVIRRDQGGDTVSEGQAYAMLVAVSIGDRARFDQVWDWTRANLQRPDELLSWHWAGGRVVDPEPAADADLDAAHALLLAGERFESSTYTASGRAIADALLQHSTVEGRQGAILVAGPAFRSTRTINPSYFAPLAYAVLGDSWAGVRATSASIVDMLMASPPNLPPDWARIPTGAPPTPVSAPGDTSAPKFGFDAARVLIRYALDCSPTERSRAARAWPFFDGVTEGGTRPPVAVYHLDGRPVVTYGHPVTTIAAAAAARSAGNTTAYTQLLRAAEAQDDAQPTYYGAAWLALAEVGFEQSLLRPC